MLASGFNNLIAILGALSEVANRGFFLPDRAGAGKLLAGDFEPVFRFTGGYLISLALLAIVIFV